MTALPVLYSFRRCPYAMRARLALASSAVAYELREVALRSKPPDMLAASPKGTVPVLVLPDGQVIAESLDVMLWALRQHDPEGWLSGDIDGMLALIADNDGTFKLQLDRYKYPNRYPHESAGNAPGFAQWHRDGGAVVLASWQARLSQNPWLFGNRASLVDMAVLPFVRQFAHTDAAWFAAQPWPHLQAWLARFEASAQYQLVMTKLLPWPAS